jgi:hypothetical protein
MIGLELSSAWKQLLGEAKSLMLDNLGYHTIEFDIFYTHCVVA